MAATAPAYLPFVLLAWGLGLGVVLLARATDGLGEGPPPVDRPDPPPVGPRRPPRGADPPSGALDELPVGLLLANVLLTQGGLAVAVGVGALLARVPPADLGLGPAAVDPTAVGLGVLAGVALYLADEVLSWLLGRAGLVPEELLRASLAPETMRGWLLLVGVVLPLVAVGEELLFRAAMVTVPAAGLGLPVVALAVGSSVLFGVAHGAQGPGGVIVTGVLGLGLVGVVLVTGSLVAAVVAHYLVNLLEFVVHETPWERTDRPAEAGRG